MVTDARIPACGQYRRGRFEISMACGSFKDWVKSRGKTRVTSAMLADSAWELNNFTDLMGKSVAERFITFILSDLAE
jgi:hypothetical protein